MEIILHHKVQIWDVFKNVQREGIMGMRKYL